MAVVYIGEDLDVLLELSDRIMVLCHGKITGIVDAKKLTKEQLGLMMTGTEAGELGLDKSMASEKEGGTGMKEPWIRVVKRRNLEKEKH